jgi:YHS domain-containing protein
MKKILLGTIIAAAYTAAGFSQCCPPALDAAATPAKKACKVQAAKNQIEVFCVCPNGCKCDMNDGKCEMKDCTKCPKCETVIEKLILRPAAKEEIGKESVCPVMDTKFKVSGSTTAAEYKGKTYFFCCDGCPKSFKDNPKKYTAPKADGK